MQSTVKKRSTDKELTDRISEALELLLEGYSPASIIRMLSKKYLVSIRQARRYINAAQLEYFAEPITRNELEFGISLHIERLDRIADTAHQEGEINVEIKAVKASAQMRENRLKTLQREQEYFNKVNLKG